MPPGAGAGRHYLHQQSPSTSSSGGRKTPSKADKVLGRDPNLYADEAQDAVSMRRLSPRGRTIEEELEMSDEGEGAEGRDAGASVGVNGTGMEDPAAAEHRAMNLVTNGGWGRSGASGLLRNHSHSPAPANGDAQRRSAGGDDDEDDDALD